ncbi:hypothetical protein ACFLYK_02985 [Candidatus Cloacimonadota bacterium]
MSLNLDLFIKKIDGKVLTADASLNSIEVTGGYVSDLLSDVMGNSKDGDAWITIMRHMNVIAVASMVGLPVIVFAKGLEPEEAVINKAISEGICLINSPLSTFEIAGSLFNLLNDS